MSSNNWESDELTLKNELKLIDDSYYRVYDDNDYETWKERMLSIIENQSKIINSNNISNTPEEPIDNSGQETTAESTINEINPIKPIILDLPSSIIYNGIEPKPPSIENCNVNVSWGMKYLLGEIDQKVLESTQKNRYKSMLLESKPGKSKWNNPNRIGQDELYQGLEKVLLDLKSYTPYSIPFLVKVSKKDVPDYYNVIKKPMDLGTMGKKLKAQEYNNKQHFLDDLNLIYSNCFTYNTAEDSIYRQHIQMLRDKWTYLLKSVPDIVVGKGIVSESTEKKPVQATKFQTEVITQPNKQQQLQAETKVKQPVTKQVAVSSDPMDDLDDLLNAHLDSLSDTESCPSPKKRKGSEAPGSPVKKVAFQRSYFSELSQAFPNRCDKLMIKYASDFKAAKQLKKAAISSSDNGSAAFVFPELVYFFNTIPDTHLIKNHSESSRYYPSSYSPVGSMNKFYDNFRILQSIRALRKHLLEGSRAEVPSIEHLKAPCTRFDRLQPVFQERIEASVQAKVVLRKVITLYLAQAGFELISNSALHTLYELVDATFTKLFTALRFMNEEFGREKDSADILRLALLQMNLKHLSDLDVAMAESSFAKERLENLLSVMCSKVDEYQLAIRNEQDESVDKEEHNEDNSENDLNEADEDANEDNDGVDDNDQRHREHRETDQEDNDGEEEDLENDENEDDEEDEEGDEDEQED